MGKSSAKFTPTKKTEVFRGNYFFPEFDNGKIKLKGCTGKSDELCEAGRTIQINFKIWMKNQ